MSLPRYQGYKNSGIAWLGDVPSHWEVIRYKELFAERNERSTEGGETLLSVSAYTGVSPRADIIDEGDFLSRAESLEGYKVCYPNDLVMNIMLAWNRGLGFSAYHGIVSPAYSVFSLKRKDNPRFLDYLVREDKTTLQFKAYSSGVIESRLRLYPEVFGALSCSVPPPEEQEAIATFLDRETAKIDALVAEQEKLLTLLAEKRQATISQAVTKGLNPDVPMKDSGVEWLGEVPAHWGHRKKLLDLVTSHRHSFVNGPFGSDLLTSELVSDGVPVIYIRDIKQSGYCRVSEWCVTEEKAAQLQFCNVLPGDVLVAKVGDPPGLAAVYPQNEPNGIITQDVIRLRLDICKADGNYVCWLLNSKYGQTAIDQISVESTRTRVGLGEYKQLRFFIPPLKEQQAISIFLDKEMGRLDALTVEALRAIGLLKERRTALISAAVTGKIDVRHLAN
ncbi:restriction endonuclease subunit S [Propionivibrio dicarboxylicus]|uniref:Type I restriction enzyme, S subunit n=1 Tax=Propionivibrio dicarboxylicus TaxID=83767 RepID=A0A1G7V8C4_9RHOO|nr:restriction endonuclease subunit S [Propionivibrio dicarboxylicus]SDG56036.1 type I restriction enzyme, S subunit [Propionivibrio dicarboxylicus]